MILRTKYLEKIKKFIDKPIIKVITGMRRVGKSYFVKQIIQLLKEQGINENAIIYINKELLDFDFIRNYKDLHNYIKDNFEGISSKKYIFIDEIQEIQEWEKAIASFFAEEEYDIYITGSNSHLLSSEISTLISGRYVEMNIYSLSFKEFLEFRGMALGNLQKEFNLYLKYGGFPVIHNFHFDEEVTYLYLNSLFDTIILNDVIKRFDIRNVRLFQDVVKFVFDNLGQTFSSNSISKFLKSQQKKINIDTIQNYLSHLESSFMLHKVQRYDLKGKKILELYEKYYLGDISLKNALLGYKHNDIAGLLENLVYLKLKQDGYNIFIGKYDDLEIDFIAEKAGEKKYFQVSYLLESEKTIEREFGVLRNIKDNYPKYVLSMDMLPPSNDEGIIHQNIIEFLLEG